MLVSVQYARALAALLVVLAHLSGFSAFQPLTTSSFGSFGVDMFFVISGFIMWETTKDQRPLDFMCRRIARIVPPYWFYTTLLVLLAVLSPRLAPNIQLSWEAILGSYFFIPYTDHRGIMNPILLQGWTLNFEMYFYIIFAASLMLVHRAIRFFAVIGLLSISALIGLSLDTPPAIVSMVTSTVLLEFALGMILAIAWRHWKPGMAAALPIIAVGSVCLILAELRQPSDDLRLIFFGIPSALFLFGLLGTENFLSRKPLRPLVAAGDASYSLYLAHPFVLSAVHIVVNGPIRNILNIDGIALALLYGALAISACLIFSHASFLFLERASARFVLRRLTRRKKDIAGASVAAT